jgi:hypothetical protein
MGIRLGVLYCSVIVGAFSQPVPTFEVASVRPSGYDATDLLKIQSHGEVVPIRNGSHTETSRSSHC